MVKIRTFMDFATSESTLGRVIFELFADIAPRTCEKSLCTGEKGRSQESDTLMYYKDSIVHRSIADFMIQAGDFTKGNGSGGESIYGGPFADEDMTRPLDKEGLLCMANRGKDTNTSQWFVTLRACPHLDGKHVVFGSVIRGMEVIRRISELPVDAKDRPTLPVKIIKCGELELRSTLQKSTDPTKTTVLVRETGARSPRSRTRSKSPLERRTKSKRSKHTAKPDLTAPPSSGDREHETEAEYDLRLEREENERLQATRMAKLQKIQSSAQSSATQGGVRFKGRGRMTFIDPEMRQR